MKSGELANACLEVCIEAQRRILTVGDEQYNNDGVQRHETETLGEHLQELEEELLDCINHSAMSILRLRSIRERITQ